MKDKKIAIFYMSEKKRNPNSSPVLVGKLSFPPNVVYVRAQVVKADNLEAALSKARPKRGEVLMNTHYVP